MLTLRLTTILIQILIAYASTQPSSNNTEHEVVLGVQHTIILNYNFTGSEENLTIVVEKISDVSTKITNFCDLKEDTERRGTIFIHFFKIESNDVGRYSVSLNNSMESHHETIYFQLKEFREATIKPKTTMKPKITNSILDLDLDTIIRYGSPALSFLICVIVVVTSLILHRKRVKVLKIEQTSNNDSSSSTLPSDHQQIPELPNKISTSSTNRYFRPPLASPDDNCYEESSFASASDERFRKLPTNRRLNSIPSYPAPSPGETRFPPSFPPSRSRLHEGNSNKEQLKEPNYDDVVVAGPMYDQVHY